MNIQKREDSILFHAEGFPTWNLSDI